jgi:hypothetical protein
VTRAPRRESREPWLYGHVMLACSCVRASSAEKGLDEEAQGVYHPRNPRGVNDAAAGSLRKLACGAGKRVDGGSVMRTTYQVTMSDGQPCVCVPQEEIWSLLEHLSYHRARTACAYNETHLSVCFLSMSLETAQQMIDDWATTRLLERGVKHDRPAPLPRTAAAESPRVTRSTPAHAP